MEVQGHMVLQQVHHRLMILKYQRLADWELAQFPADLLVAVLFYRKILIPYLSLQI